MHIRDLFRQGSPLFSIELFPPKTPEGVAGLKDKLQEIRAHRPDFISVTYGAGGGTRHTTHEICAHIQAPLGMVAMAHLTCAAHTRDEIAGVLARLHAAGIDNIMALRGDPPPGGVFVAPEHGYAHAVDLVRVIAEQGHACIGVAGYPQGHAEASSYIADLARQVEKIQAGADFVVSQFFLDNAHFLRWRDDLARRGVTVPVLAGILPALSAPQVARFAKLAGVSIPAALMAGLEHFEEHPESAAAYGLVYAMRQVDQLLSEGVAGIHLYALNRLESIRSISALVRERQVRAQPGTRAHLTPAPG
ncbi:MAG TPA: methylenetetrahydrofolate reductase [bacterium]|nr:methylenetetrahydrofolate reductase [bacterium]